MYRLDKFLENNEGSTVDYVRFKTSRTRPKYLRLRWKSVIDDGETFHNRFFDSFSEVESFLADENSPVFTEINESN
jgi:hypothetical protein|tara:strand:+ start:4297 stop:4524 length:228 start_codon:yes stop_codon:yes gene_type:complete